MARSGPPGAGGGGVWWGSLAPVLRSLVVVTKNKQRLLVFLGIMAAIMAGLAMGVSRWVADSLPSAPGIPQITEQQVREAMYTALERESAAAFLVTGQLKMNVTTRVENSKVLLPGVIGLNLGTTRATVRVPGRVSYGFEADSLRPEMVRMLDDGTIQVEIPALAVYSAEADLSRLEVETTRGWARIGSQEGRVERRALSIVETAMRRQALSHLRTSYQPRVNAARALERILVPALRGLGMEDPQLRFRLADDLVVLPTG